MMFDNLKKRIFGKSLFLGFIASNMMTYAISMDTLFAEGVEGDGVKVESTMLESPRHDLSEQVNCILETIVEKIREDKVSTSFETLPQNMSDVSTNAFQGTDLRKRALSNNRIKIYSSPVEPRVRRTSSGSIQYHPIERVKSQEKLLQQAVSCEINFQG